MKKLSLSDPSLIPERLARLAPANMTTLMDWLVGALYSLSTILLFLAVVNAWNWAQAPFPGLLVEPTLVITGVQGEGWAGEAAGLSHPQQVTHINGRPVESLEDFAAFFANAADGDMIDIQTRLPDGSVWVSPQIRLTAFPHPDWLRYFLLPFGVGLLFWLLGLWAYTQRRRTSLGVSFAYFCLVAALSSALIFDLSTSHRWAHIWFLAIAQQGGALITLGIFFLEQWQTSFFHKRLSLVPLALSMAVSLGGILVMNTSSDPWAYLAVWRFGYYYAAAGFVIFILLIFSQARKGSSEAVKQQARIILWGSFFAFLPVVVWMGSPLVGYFMDWNPSALLPPMAIFPISIGIAVLRYHLWDFNVIVNRALVYGILSAVLAGVYFGSIVILQQVLYGWSQQASPTVITISTILTITLVNPFRTRLQTFIDRQFFRRKYDAAQTLTEFVQKLRDFIDLDILERELQAAIRATMQPTQVKLCNCVPAGAGQGNEDTFEEGPLRDYLLENPDAVEVERLEIASPQLEAMRRAGVQLIVPLVSQGEMVGLLKLGPRRSGQVYTSEDLNLLNMLAGQAAPALRVARLVREQREEALERQRMQSELQLAGLVQQTLLPKEVPQLPGWELAVHYQPAREVSGDMYDFFVMQDGRMVLIIGDVTDKGIPAALIMTTIRSILRGAIRRELPPGIALERSNGLLAPEMLPNMFVTCHYAILEPDNGRYHYANAGHNLPICKRAEGIEELSAKGFPLGIVPEAEYQEHESTIHPGESILLFSDGLTEAHNPQGDIYGTHRLMEFMQEHADDGPALIADLLADLQSFTGPDWKQEDDVTIVYLRRSLFESIQNV